MKLKSALILFLRILYSLLGRSCLGALINMVPIIGRRAWTGQEFMLQPNDTSILGGQATPSIPNGASPTSPTPSPISASCSITKSIREAQTTVPNRKANETLPAAIDEYEIDQFVFCWGTDFADFGKIASRTGDYYVVELLNTEPKWASVPIENIRQAGRA